MPKKPTTNKVQSRNSLCRATDHDWLAGTNWRVCQRDGCRASESLVEGQWVSTAAFYRKHVPVETDGTRQYLRRQARQHSLWTDPPEGGSR